MSDGAHLGADAAAALNAVLGDDDEREAINRGDRQKTPAEMRRSIMEGVDPGSYGGAANALAAVLIRLMDDVPEARSWPASDDGVWIHEDDTECESFAGCDRYHDYRKLGLDNLTDGFEQWVRDNRHDPIAKTGDRAYQGCTGFMWGWAANAARYVHFQPPGPNPAIVTIETT